MKYTIIGILLFASITAYFSIYGERVPFDRTQNEGWVISGGDSGTPIPHEGGEGQMDAFVFVQEIAEQETTQETTQETEPQTFSFDVSMETAQQQNVNDYFFCGVCVGALAVEIVMVAVILVWFVRRKKKITEVLL